MNDKKVLEVLEVSIELAIAYTIDELNDPSTRNNLWLEGRIDAFMFIRSHIDKLKKMADEPEVVNGLIVNEQ
jgi:hypothetical protein